MNNKHTKRSFLARAAMTLAVLLLSSTGAWAETITVGGTEYTLFTGTGDTGYFTIDGYNIPNNSYTTYSNYPQLKYDRFLDGDKDTYWGVRISSATFNNFYIDFHTKQPVIIKGYVLTTGHDTSSNLNYNPKTWKLYGRTTTAEEWTEIDSRDTDNTDDALPVAPKEDKTYSMASNTSSYQYFRFEVTGLGKIGSYWYFQMSELQLFGNVDGNYKYNLAYGSLSVLSAPYTWTGNPITATYTMKDANNTVLEEGKDFTAAFTPSPVQVFGEYTLTVTGTAPYYGTKSTKFRVRKLLTGSGTADAPYLIKNDEDWLTFVDLINNFNSDYRNKFFKLTSDINVTAMAGTESATFYGGIFDGGGHTMTLNLTADGDVCAPFRYVEYGTRIKRLHVTGSITTAYKYAAGLVGYNKGPLYIDLCRSSVTINSTYSGSNSAYAGFVGEINNSTYITDCCFDGSFIGENASKWSGFVGAQKYSTVKLYLTNCLVDPVTVNIKNGSNYTFAAVSDNLTLTNSYYTTSIGTIQGESQGHMTLQQLKDALGTNWKVSGEHVVPVMDTHDLSIATIRAASYLPYTGQAIPLSYTVEDYEANTLTRGTDYTVMLDDVDVTDKASPTVKNEGTYTLTVTGTNQENGYYGSRTFTFTVGVYIGDDVYSLFRGFETTDAKEGDATSMNNANQTHVKLVDGDRSTLWRTSSEYNNNQFLPLYIEFNYTRRIFPKGYILTTGNDVENTNGAKPNNYKKNPTKWTLKGKQKASDEEWTTLATVDNSPLPATNTTDVLFLTDDNVTDSYQFFRLDITGNGGTVTNSKFTMELSEIQLFGSIDNTFALNLENATISGLEELYNYTGDALNITYTVTDFDGNELTENVHYTASFSPAEVKETGTYTLTITGKGNYTGSQSATFRVMVNPEKLGDYAFSTEGTGENKAYLINSEEELENLAAYVNGGGETAGLTFKLNVDDGFTMQNEHTAIGKSSNAFNGTFDGNNKTITGLTINKPGSSNQGLFGYVGANSTIKDLTLSGCDITGSQNTGGIVGYIEGTSSSRSSITNCHVVNGVITGKYANTGSRSGGIVGYGDHTDINGCTITGTVTAEATYCGGIIGYLNYTTVKNCENAASITGTASCGGIIGYIYHASTGSFENCLNTGIVNGTREVGGIVGDCDGYYNHSDMNTYYKYFTKCYFANNPGKLNGVGDNLSEGDDNFNRVFTITHGPRVTNMTIAENPTCTGMDGTKYYIRGEWTLTLGTDLGDDFVTYTCVDGTLTDATIPSGQHTLGILWKDSPDIIIDANEISIAMNAAGIRTYASNYDLELSSVNAYVVSDYNMSEHTLTLAKVNEAPASTGLLIKVKNNSQKGKSIILPLVKGSAEAIGTNLLVGTVNNDYVKPTSNGYTNFVLANGTYGIDWYTLSETGNIGYNKAYLQLPTAELPTGDYARGFSWVYEDASGISSVTMDNGNGDDVWHSLNGVRLISKPTKRGIYVKDGKKIVIK